VLILSFTALSPVGAKANECDDDVEVLIAKEAIHQGVSVDLALAVARVESGMKHQVRGKRGEIGLFQIMPYHAKEAELLSIKGNIKIGVGLLKIALQKCNDMGEMEVICYNNGVNRRPKYPHLHPYYRKVMEAMR
jgi:soluble lytic murein transglycosylase-like protein